MTTTLHVRETSTLPGDWVVVNVTLRVVNLHFLSAMTSPQSEAFRRMQSTICTVIRSIFAESEYSKHFMACWVNSFWSGSLMTEVSLGFEGIPQHRADTNSLKQQPSSTSILSPSDEHVLIKESENDDVSPVISINASHVTTVLFQSAYHVIQNSEVHWLLGKLKLDPSTLPAPVSGPWLQKGAKGGRREARDTHSATDRGQKTRKTVSWESEDLGPTAHDAKTPSVHMKSHDGMEGTGEVHVQCDVTDPGEWRELVVWFHTSGNVFVKVLQLAPLSEPRFAENPEKTSKLRALTKMTSEHVEARLYITKPNCYDSGTYSCWLSSVHHSNVMAATNLIVYSRPSAPIFDLPIDIMEGHALPEPIRCHSDVGHPPGNLRMYANSGKDTRELTKDDGLTLKYRKHGCGLVAELTLTSAPGVNGTELVCVVDNTHVEGRDVVIETRAVLMEIPVSVCHGQGHLARVGHPYSSCSKFLVCDGRNLFLGLCPAHHCFVPSVGACEPVSKSAGPSG